MVSIDDVWDSTTAVLAGGAGLLLPIAVLASFLPAVVQAAMTAYLPKTPGVAALAALVAIGAMVATLWGQLATVAVASDPGATRAQAGAAATGRLPAALLVTLVLVAGAIVAILPIVVALWASGFDFRAAAAQAGGAGTLPVRPDAAVFIFFYGLLLAGAGLWLAARLSLLNPVILAERRGIGAIGRSTQLTRGLTLKLIGVVILFLIVLVVAGFAAKSVSFVIVRLLLGSAQVATATFVGAIAAAAVTAALIVVASVFSARLYATIGDARAPVGPDVGPDGGPRVDLAK